MFDNKLLTEKKLKVAYKLLHDLLLILFGIFLLTLIAEGLLPGIVSSRVGLYKMALAILFVIFLINLSSNKLGIVPSLALSKKIVYVLLFVLAALILNGMRGIGLTVSIFVLFPALAMLYLLYKIFFPPSTSP